MWFPKFIPYDPGRELKLFPEWFEWWFSMFLSLSALNALLGFSIGSVFVSLLVSVTSVLNLSGWFCFPSVPQTNPQIMISKVDMDLKTVPDSTPFVVDHLYCLAQLLTVYFQCSKCVHFQSNVNPVIQSSGGAYVCCILLESFFHSPILMIPLIMGIPL